MNLKIPSRASQCDKGHVFENPIVSQLFKDEEGVWTRKDSCEKCSAKNEEAYCTWQSMLHAKKVESTPLLEHFRSFEADPKELCFLAEILLRQKQLLRLRRTKTEQVLEDAVTGDVYVVARLSLTVEEVRHFSLQYLESP